MEENPSVPSSNMPQQRQQPEATPNVTTLKDRKDTPWANTMPASRNLFEDRANWPIPPTETPTVVKMEKTEVPPQVPAIPHAMVLNKPQNNRSVGEKCTWGPHCPSAQKRKKVQKTGMVTDRKASRGPTTPKILNISKPMAFLISFSNISS